MFVFIADRKDETMGFSIAQAAERTGISAHTLRYYDKEGLLPHIKRDASGNRDFSESDLGWLKTVTCLKNTGMPIKNIRQFLEWVMEGDSTIEERLAFFQAHRKVVEEKMTELQGYLDRIDYKIKYYEVAAEAGTTAVHEKSKQVS